jgi:hypothetical protein
MNALRNTLFAAIALAGTAGPAAAQDSQMPQYTNGTAFFITRDGYLLTANHVVKGCAGKPYVSGRFIVAGDALAAPEPYLGAESGSVETTLEVKVVATDPENDLALLKIRPNLAIENYTLLRARNQPVRLEDTAIAAGYPLTSVEKLRLLEFQVQTGKVIAMRVANAPKNTFFVAGDGRPLGTHGYSGGPILDIAGNVIGVNLAIACLGKRCTDNTKQFREDFGETLTASLLPPDTYQEKLEAYLDSSMVADLHATRTFLDKNNIVYEEAPSDSLASQARIVKSSHSIANVGCTLRSGGDK